MTAASGSGRLGSSPAEKELRLVKNDVVRQIRKATRRKFTADEKIRVVLEGLRGEIPVTELCRKESISPAIYYKWSKAFLESGRNGLTKDTKRDATSDEVKGLRSDNVALKLALADSSLEVIRLKKSLGM